MGRPRIHDEDTRAALLDAAGRIVAREGPGSLSLRRLADQVGASTQAIYTLFDSKPGLIRAMHRQGFTSLDRRLRAVEPVDDPVAHLTAMALAYRASALAHPHLYDVMFGCPFPEFEPSPEDDRFALGTLEHLRVVIWTHIVAGRLRSEDPERLTLQVWALAHGLASLELKGALGTPADAQGTWVSAINLLVGALRASSSS